MAPLSELEEVDLSALRDPDHCLGAKTWLAASRGESGVVDPAANPLCDPRQVTCPLWASAFPSGKWGE